MDERDEPCDPEGKCNPANIAPHPCPFQMEVWNDFEDHCQCCPHAEHECAMDV